MINFYLSTLKRSHGISQNFTRGLSYADKKKVPKMTYYPRFPDEKQPEIEPSPLFMVQRVKPLKGERAVVKQIMLEFNLNGKMRDIQIVKNIPEMCGKLWKVKHMVKITPITFPNGIPKEGDECACYLNHLGECKVIPQSQEAAEGAKAIEEFKQDKKRIDGEFLRKHLRLKWVNPW